MNNIIYTVNRRTLICLTHRPFLKKAKLLTYISEHRVNGNGSKDWNDALLCYELGMKTRNGLSGETKFTMLEVGY
jgi:hypothetical protein